MVQTGNNLIYIMIGGEWINSCFLPNRAVKVSHYCEQQHGWISDIIQNENTWVHPVLCI